MFIKNEKLTFGINLGYNLSELDLISMHDWDGDDAKKLKEKIRALVSSDKFAINDNSYDSFISSILGFYVGKDCEIYYAILMGSCFQKCIKANAIKESELIDIFTKSAKNTLTKIPDDVMDDKEEFFQFCLECSEEPLPYFVDRVCKRYSAIETKKFSKGIKKGPYVFISYCRDNNTFANEMRQFLINKGYSVWMAPYDIPAAQKYAAVLTNALENCACVLLLLSKESQESIHVEREINLALTFDKSIVTVKIGDFEINKEFKYYITTSQFLTVSKTEYNFDNMEKLLLALAMYVNPKELARQKYQGLSLKKQFSLFQDELTTKRVSDAKWACEHEGWDLPSKEGAFILSNDVLSNKNSTDDELIKADIKNKAWILIYRLVEEGGYYDICDRIKRVSEKEYNDVIGFLNNTMTNEMKAINKQYAESLTEADATCDPYDVELFEQLAENLMVMSFLCDEIFSNTKA